jgi:hypothetical protein
LVFRVVAAPRVLASTAASAFSRSVSAAVKAASDGSGAGNVALPVIDWMTPLVKLMRAGTGLGMWREAIDRPTWVDVVMASPAND